jgi:hypothetical protein
MASIADHLVTLNLPQYQSRFAADGISSVTQLLPLSESELDAKLAALGLLKGHAIKFRLSLETIRSRGTQPAPVRSQPATPVKPTPTPTPVRPVSKPPIEDNPLMLETQKITAKLVEIDSLKEAINASKTAILRLDVEAYRKVLDQIEALQRSLHEQEPEESVEMVEAERTE